MFSNFSLPMLFKYCIIEINICYAFIEIVTAIFSLKREIRLLSI